MTARDERFTVELEDGREVKLPTRREVCPACRGRGITTSHVEPDGGGFTGEEWSRACHEDPDFAENYMGGVYDRPCPECGGANVVDVVDVEACEGVAELGEALELFEEGERWAAIDAANARIWGRLGGGY